MNITHTNDSLKLIEFLRKYPNHWHGYAQDKRTLKAVTRICELYPSEMETNEHEQMRFTIKDFKLFYKSK